MMITSSSFLDVVYAVVYSLLLLNTDLHVAQGNHHRMSKQEFIKNTMLAIHAQLRLQPEIVDSIHFNADMEKYLKVSVLLQTVMNINIQFFVCTCRKSTCRSRITKSSSLCLMKKDPMILEPGETPYDLSKA
jgi:Sec7-like guanine-nucleotide exchange factor